MSKENKKIVKTATEALKILWEQEFFSRYWRKIVVVIEEFSKRGYHFSPTNVDKALQRAPYLIRRGKRGGYEYIQKYPFINNENKK